MSLTNTAQRVLTFHYLLKDKEGQEIDKSETAEPLVILTGQGTIIPKLEDELTKMVIGQKKIVSLTADEAYGKADPKMLMDVPKKDLAHVEQVVGGWVEMQLANNRRKLVRISKITEDTITLDGNHPLAGMDLEFEVELVDTRAATSEEISHGHAHGPGGHHHH